MDFYYFYHLYFSLSSFQFIYHFIFCSIKTLPKELHNEEPFAWHCLPTVYQKTSKRMSGRPICKSGCAKRKKRDRREFETKRSKRTLFDVGWTSGKRDTETHLAELTHNKEDSEILEEKEESEESWIDFAKEPQPYDQEKPVPINEEEIDQPVQNSDEGSVTSEDSGATERAVMKQKVVEMSAPLMPILAMMITCSLTF